MGAKPKNKPIVVDAETPENMGADEPISIEPEIVESAIVDSIIDSEKTVELTGVFPSEQIELRIMQLLRRRGGVFGLHGTVAQMFPGEPLPSNDDEWIAVMNRLER